MRREQPSNISETCDHCRKDSHRMLRNLDQKVYVIMILNSNDTHDHVFGELNLYAPLVSVGSYCVVFDTVIEDLDGVEFVDRPWGKGDNPKTALAEFLTTNSDFVVDYSIDEKLLISAAPGGYLKRVK